MSFSLNTHRPTESSHKSVSLDVIPWSAEYDWSGNGSANTTELTSIATGRTYPSEVTFQSKPVQNVYANSWLAQSPQKLPNKSGVKPFWETKETWSKTSSDDASYEALIPNVWRTTGVISNDALVTPSVVFDSLLRHFSAIIADGTGVNVYDWLARLLMGSTNPTLTINND